MFGLAFAIAVWAFSLITITFWITIPWILLHLYFTYIRSTNQTRREDAFKSLGVSSNKRLVGFFHPYCNAGGEAERVLWTAVAALQRNEPEVISVVYTGDVDASKEEIIDKVKTRFDITLEPSKVIFVFLRLRGLLDTKTWPYFTLLGQSIGSMYLAWDGMKQLIPDLYIDTTGYAFTFHVVSWVAHVPVGAYINHPTISTDILDAFEHRKRWSRTNSDTISSSYILSSLKSIYYRLFIHYYSLSLRSADFVMVNSSVTKKYVDSVLHYTDPFIDFMHLCNPTLLILYFLATHTKGTPGSTDSSQIVYPGGDTVKLAELPLTNRERVVVSVGQFRREEDHAMQLYALHELDKMYPEYGLTAGNKTAVKLVLIGGCKDEEDALRVSELKLMVRELGLQDQVEFIVNASYSEKLKWLGKAGVGIHTAPDDGFGFGVVEYMASGVIPVVHASGGPICDIVVPYGNDSKPTGYHARTTREFSKALHSALSLAGTDPEEDLAIRQRARRSVVERFSLGEFEEGWVRSIRSGGGSGSGD
ncbi:mannosyltransferase [Marasmius fiardii PR-910]|nr:mannosyltransferase [Marasmius fiardii PR-910]